MHCDFVYTTNDNGECVVECRRKCRPPRVVEDCDRPRKRDCLASKGLGDTIAKITDSLGIRKCGGCKKRQAKLNKLVPYSKEST